MASLGTLDADAGHGGSFGLEGQPLLIHKALARNTTGLRALGAPHDNNIDEELFKRSRSAVIPTRTSAIRPWPHRR